MDIFKYNNPIAPLKMEDGQILNGITSKMWIERYAEAGEFKLVAPLHAHVRELLPEGCFISHVDSSEIMIVENIEIADDQGKESDVVITGRGFETFLENRIVGSNKSFPRPPPVGDPAFNYFLPEDYAWAQVIELIKDHTDPGYLLDDNSAVPYMITLSNLSGGNFLVGRSLEPDTVYDTILEILKAEDLGIKVYRPGYPNSPLAPPYIEEFAVLIHKGVDRRDDITFSNDFGEIVSADYLWSNKKIRNAAYIRGKWVETVIIPLETEYDRRMIFVDAKEIDDKYQTSPTGTTLTNIITQMQRKGAEAIFDSSHVVIQKAEIAQTAVRAQFRQDYDVGDIITVDGDYNKSLAMRVTEYVEIEDQDGQRGYPTLETLD